VVTLKAALNPPDPLYESASVDPLVEDNPAAHAHAEAGRAMKPVDLPMRTKLRPITAHLHHRNTQMNARADGQV